MSLLIGFLSFILVMDCLILVLLILAQLPKKEAGIGTAFGSGATDALFGAGSGNVLTKVTKYTAGIFLGLALVLSIMIVRVNAEKGGGVIKALQQKAAAAPKAALPVEQLIPPPVKPVAATNTLLLKTNDTTKTNTTAAPSAPPPAPEKK